MQPVKKVLREAIDLEKNPTLLPVVAGALRRSDGRWLMHKRPADKHHGGLWEFPGGKVEASEIKQEALKRELCEELGIEIDLKDGQAYASAIDQGISADPTIVIDLYIVENWHGEPAALEGGEVGWFTLEEIENLDKPPLDVALAAQLLAKLTG